MRTSSSGLGWLIVGSIVVLGLFSFLLDMRAEGVSIARVQGSAAERLEALRSALGALSDSEKSAVLSVTERDASVFIAEARAHRADAERATAELRALLEKSGTPSEKEHLVALASTLDAQRKLDDELLDLAAQHTNLRAYALAYGPLAEASATTTAALGRIFGHARARSQLVAAADARFELLRIEVLLPPHIAEASNVEMDALEARMHAASVELEHSLAALSPGPDRDEARSGTARFFVLERQIIALSRQNTNVRALALSLDQRRAMVEHGTAAIDALAEVIARARADSQPSRLRR